jgi:hypothetical protein
LYRKLEGGIEMRVLDKEEKKIYESLNIPFKFIDCWDVKIPYSWKKPILIAKFDEVEK